MNVTEQLRDLITDEPPYLLDPEPVLAGGRRRRRTRLTVLTTLGATGAAVLGTVLLAPGNGPAGTQVLLGTPTAASDPVAQGKLESLVRAQTPASWTFSEVHESDGFQADVDDGSGASRLYVGLSPSPGSLQQHPCSDHEFALDSVCREVELDADTRLITRGPAASGPVTSEYVVIVHRDGSGVDVGNDNATWPYADLAPGTTVTEAEKRRLATPSVNRTMPVYSLNQLVEIAKAVDAAT